MESTEQQGPIDREAARERLEILAADRTTAASRAMAPWWFLALQGAGVAGFALCFGLGIGQGQATGFALVAILFVGLSIIRPVVTGNRAEPWSSRRVVLPGFLQMITAFGIVALGVAAYAWFDVGWALWPTALLAGAVTVLFGIRMEHALARSIAEGN